MDTEVQEEEEEERLADGAGNEEAEERLSRPMPTVSDSSELAQYSANSDTNTNTSTCTTDCKSSRASSASPAAGVAVGFLFHEYSNASLVECRTHCRATACDFYE